MHSRPSHVSLVLTRKSPLSRPMHDSRIVPANNIAGLPPLDFKHVPVLRSVREQPLNQICGLGLRHAATVRILQMMQMVRDVQIHATRPFVLLHNSVAPERVRLRVDVPQKVRFGRGLASRVHQTVGAHVVVLQKLRLEIGG